MKQGQIAAALDLIGEGDAFRFDIVYARHGPTPERRLRFADIDGFLSTQVYRTSSYLAGRSHPPQLHVEGDTERELADHFEQLVVRDRMQRAGAHVTIEPFRFASQ